MRIFDGELLWSIKATHGLPLDVALDRLAMDELVPSWAQLYAAAQKDGADLDKLTRELMFFVREAYPAQIAAEMRARLPFMPAYTRSRKSWLARRRSFEEMRDEVMVPKPRWRKRQAGTKVVGFE